MKLHLLRHAKTNQESATGKDFDRRLLPKGIKQADQMSHFLSNLENLEIHCSSSARTRQTYELISPNLPMVNVHFSDDLYLASHLQYLAYINKILGNKDLLIIGHNNGLSDLATYLSDEFIDLKTCEYVSLEIPLDNWKELSKGTGTILERFRPEVD